MKKAIILLSGGMDSTVVLAMALHKGRECVALSFDYGQRNKVELNSAKLVAQYYGIAHHVVIINTQGFSNSALTNHAEVPKNRSFEEIATAAIPTTYVPARNTIFLSYAMGLAEMIGAAEIYYGANQNDNVPYPDCTLEYVEAFQHVLNVGTKQAREVGGPQLIAPIIKMSKKEIAHQGKALQAPIEMTFSCYDPTPDGKPCHECDACLLRAEALSCCHH